jgi:anti-sigma B factor antagonist
VSSEQRSDDCLIAVAGDADMTAVTEVQAHLDRAVRSGCWNLVVDLSEVTFIDSSFLHMLLRAVRRTRMAGGDLELVCNNDEIRRTLDVFGITGSIRIHSRSI